jgi:hypothetical protein
MENNGETLLHDMINDDADEKDYNYAQYEETQYVRAHEGYSTDNQPLFGNDGFTQSMGEADTQTMAEGITQATAASLAVMDSDSKKVSQRTASYTTEEDKLLYNAWIEISQDPL